MGVLKRLDGSLVEIPDHEMGEALASGKFRPADDEQDIAIVEDGNVSTVKGKDYESYKTLYGAEDESAESFRRREDRARMERERGGIASKAATLAEGFASGLSLGAYDALGGVIGGDEFRTRRKESKLVNPELDTAGEVLSYLAPTGLAKAPGALGKIAKYSPVGLAERAGERIAAKGIGGGAIKQIGYAGAGLAAEGVAVSLGESLSDYSLATSDLEREQIIGNVGSNVVMGAATGGALGGAVKGVGLALKKGKKVADSIATKADEKRALAKLPDDVAGLDLEGIKSARKAEQDLISEQIFESATSYQKLAGDINPMLAAGAKDKISLISLRRKIDNALANPKGFKKSPGSKIEDALQREELAYRKILDGGEDLMAKLAKEDAVLVKRLDAVEDGVLTGKLASKYGDLTGQKITKAASDTGVKVATGEIDSLKRALENGQLGGARKQALDRIPELIEANLAQQNAISMLKEGATPRLTELRMAEDAIKSAPKEVKGIAQRVGEGTVLSVATAGLASIGFPWLPAAIIGSSVSDKLSSMIFGKLGKAAKKTAEKTSGYIDTFLDASAKVAQVTPPLATKVLAGVRFGEEDKADRSFHKSELAKAFKAREAELYSKVIMGRNGITMKPSARRAVASQLAGVRLSDPVLADSMESMINRRISFLARKIPKRPDYMKDSVGPDTWTPSNEEMRGWARYVAAAEDPSGVEERLADGTITPEDVEAYREVYPQRYQDIRQKIAAGLPELQATLPITKRIALSLFTDLDVEPALNPIIFGRLQAQYGEEPGTEGGSQAPLPQANFGAFGTNRSADKLKTPSQNRTS